MATLLRGLVRPSTTPVSPPTEQVLIAKALFKIDISTDKYLYLANGINVYFHDWYNQQCRECGQEVSMRSHGNLLEVIACIHEENATYNSVLNNLHQKLPTTSPANDLQLDAAITLAIRVSCALSIGHINNSFPPGQILSWPASHDVPIRQHILDAFEPEPLSNEVVKLPRLFNARNLAKIGGIEVCWSSNLADHLLMKDDETKVVVFHHASILKIQSESHR